MYEKEENTDIALLIAELEKDFSTLDSLVMENQRARERIDAGAKDTLDYAALGYTIHSLYCLFENYLLRIAKTFEGQIRGDSWHKDLIRRMTLTIEAVRPAFLDEKTAESLDELRSFRHVFLNLYQGGIKPEKIREIQEKVPEVVSSFSKSHKAFLRKLKAMIA